MPGPDDGLGKKAEGKIKQWLDDPSSGYSFDDEIWKPVVSYNGIYKHRYLVSDHGSVLSVYKGNIRLLKHHTFHPWNYQYVVLTCSPHTNNALIHRLVAEAFIPNPKRLPEVDHKDCNKFNNCVNNLSWVTRQENEKRAYKNGLLKSCSKTHMRNMALCKAKRIKCITTNETFESLESCKRHFNISNAQFSNARYSKSGNKSAFKINDLLFIIIDEMR